MHPMHPMHPMRPLPRVLAALALAAALAACGGGTGDVAGGDTPADTSTSTADDTSTPADGDVEPTGEVTRAEAEAIGNAYVGLTEEEAQSQAEVDGRPFRVGARDGEQFALTEDYVLGRVTATITDGVVTEVTIESSDGPITVSQ